MLGSISINKANPTQNFEMRQKNCPFAQRDTTILFTQSPVYLSRTGTGTTVTEQKPAVSLDMFLLHYETQELRENRKNEKKILSKRKTKKSQLYPITILGTLHKRERKDEKKGQEIEIYVL